MSESDHSFHLFRPLIIFLAIIWIAQIANFVTGYNLNSWFGLMPRESKGLPGIFLHSFLHADFQHAALNSAPLALMGGVILAIDRRKFIPATLMIILIAGCLIWIFAKSRTIHVGASGVVFGYLSYLVVYGIRTRSWAAIFGAIAAVIFYGYLIRGAMPSDTPGISWEGHLFGLFGGAIAAYFLSGKKQKSPA
ncbi:MAG: rhomboid family intramembrane serine protease [Hellea sp.]|nr:rhomboid family intramembrane serine protease [Hellea sp.]